MKKFFLSFFFLSMFFWEAGAQTWNWVLSAPVPNNTYSDGGKISSDSYGNRYISGSFYDSISIAGVTLHTNAQNYLAIYVFKFDTSCQVLWYKILEASNYTHSSSMVVSPDGTCYLGGSAIGTMQIDSTTFSSTLEVPVIWKLTSDGICEWIKYWPANSIYAGGICRDLALDDSENIYACGFLYSDSIIGSTDHYGAFLSKLDSSGNEVWLNRMQMHFVVTNSCSNCFSFDKISLDEFNHIYVTGSFHLMDTLEYGIIGTDTIYYYYEKNFFSSFDFNGNYRFTVDSLFYYGLPYLTTLLNGDLVVVSYFNGSAYFNYYDSTRNYNVSMVLLGGIGVKIISTDIDSYGNLIVYGSYIDTLNFNGQLLIPPFNGSQTDMFLVSVNTSSNQLNWYYTFGGNLVDSPSDVYLDDSNNIFLCGEFKSDSCYFGPFTIPHFGDHVRFWGEIEYPCFSTFCYLTDTACNSYTLNGETFTSTGFYNQTISNATGCDSILNLSLVITNINNPTYYSLIDSGCNSYTLNSQIYTSSGLYSQTLVNSTGCDSILTLNLTINHSTSNSITETACGSFTANGLTFTSSGTFIQTLANSIGCDSILTLILTIYPVEVSVIQTGITLTANATSAAYQWLNCDSTFAIINGATNQTFTPSANGNYAVAITQNGCTDTSDCYAVTGVGIESQSAVGSMQLAVFPNPANEEITIECSSSINEIQITDVLGREIYTAQTNSQLSIINCQLFSPSIYFVRVKTNYGWIVRKFVKSE